MPDPNSAPPGYFRDLETMAVAINTMAAKVAAVGVDVSALPAGDPVRVAVEAKVAETMTVADGVPPRLRTYDGDFEVP